MKIKTRNLTTKPQPLGGCTGIDGRQFRHGDYYTPQQSACNKCLCKDGQPDRCVQLQCPKPNCKSYERVPGTCCEYKCIKEFVLTDKSTAAVVASLSIILVVILVAISLVWKKMKRKEKYGQRFQTISPSNSQQETDLDTLIQKNSIPNNLRMIKNQGMCKQDPSKQGSCPSQQSSSANFTTNNLKDNLSNSPLLNGDIDDIELCKKDQSLSSTAKQGCGNDDNTRAVSPSSVKLHRQCSAMTDNTNYTSVSLDDGDEEENDSPFGDDSDCVPVVNDDVCKTSKSQQQHSCCATTSSSITSQQQNTVCLHRMRRFEPPPPYTASCSDGSSSDPIAFV